MKDMLAASIERILTDLAKPDVTRAAEAGTWPSALWQQIEEAGLPLALVPEALGGVGLGWRDIAPLLRACGRHAAPVPLPEAIAAHALAARAGQALPAGIPTLALLAREPDGAIGARGVPFAAAATHVVGTLPTESGDLELLVLARTDAQSTPSDGSLAGDGRCNLRWPAPAPVLRSPLHRAASSLEVGAAVRTAQIAGAMSRVLDMAVTYANERRQFGQPIGKFQAIQQQLSVLGEMATAAAMAAELACSSVTTQLDPQVVACAKSTASEAAAQAAPIAHAVHGAIGITEEHDLQLYTRRLWAWRLDFGSESYWNAVVGQRLLEGTGALWDEVIEGSTTAA